MCFDFGQIALAHYAFSSKTYEQFYVLPEILELQKLSPHLHLQNLNPVMRIFFNQRRNSLIKVVILHSHFQVTRKLANGLVLTAGMDSHLF